jgi:hypothetical protein
VIEQEEVDRYVCVTARLKKLEELKGKLREGLLDAFRNGAKCPTEGPFLLNYSTQDRTKSDWKSALLDELVVKFRGDKMKAKAELDRIYEMFPTEPVEIIGAPTANPSWTGEKK